MPVTGRRSIGAVDVDLPVIDLRTENAHHRLSSTMHRSSHTSQYRIVAGRVWPVKASPSPLPKAACATESQISVSSGRSSVVAESFKTTTPRCLDRLRVTGVSQGSRTGGDVRPPPARNLPDMAVRPTAQNSAVSRRGADDGNDTRRAKPSPAQSQSSRRGGDLSAMRYARFTKPVAKPARLEAARPELPGREITYAPKA